MAFKAPVDSEPEMALVPLQAPEAMQVSALVVVQVSVDEPPATTAVGLAVKVRVGAAGGGGGGGKGSVGGP